MKMEKKDDYQERSYQGFFVDLAKKRNVICCLPTGSGKTFIALQLTKWYLEKAMKTRQKIVFLANTIPLVNQQANSFRSYLCANDDANDDDDDGNDSNFVECITSHRLVDDWHRGQWEKTLNNCHVMVMTTQLLVNALNHKYMSWSDITLLILDECHHTDKDHAMGQVMSRYINEKEVVGEGGVPRVLGLTATIINGKAGNTKNKNAMPDVAMEVKAAESRLNAVAVTYHDYEKVLEHSTSATIDYKTFSIGNYFWSSNNLTEGFESFSKVLANTDVGSWGLTSPKVNHPSFQPGNCFGRKDYLKDLKSIMKEILEVYKDLGPYCARIAARHKIALIKAMPSSSFIHGKLKDLHQELKEVLVDFVSKLDYEMMTMADRVKIFVTDKIKKLLDVLKMWSPRMKREAGQSCGDRNSDELCGIIFVQNRITAQCLAFYLQDLSKDPQFNFLKVDFVVGTSGYELDPEEMRVTAKKQESVLLSFHAKKINLLVATKVIEEGMNVPSCNVVVRFDEIFTYPSYVQSMGRARKPNSKFIVFASDLDQAKFKQQYEKFDRINKQLAAYLREQALHADDDDDNGDKEDLTSVRRIIPDFEPFGIGTTPRISAVDSISLVMRYCQTLFCDRFVTLAPISWIGSEKMYTAFLQFPSNSVIREIIEGKKFRSKMHAKRYVYLEACKLLYERGALDEHLLPISRKKMVTKNNFMDSIIFEMDDSGRKVGTNKRTQQYVKKIPLVMKKAVVKPEAGYRAYRIVIEQNHSNSNVLSTFFQFVKRDFSFGLITPMDLSVIPPFLLHVNPTVGTLTVFLEKIDLAGVNKGVASFPQINELEKLSYFEEYIFEDLLQIRSAIMTKSSGQPIVIAPLKRGTDLNFQINWDLIEDVRSFKKNPPTAPSKELRKNFIFDEKAHTDAVVYPWYTKGRDFLYTVLEVKKDLTPLSPFPNPKNYGNINYKTYFERKYAFTVNSVASVTQPLLTVKEVGRSLNFFTSKVFNSQMSKLERKAEKRGIIVLIPELCLLHPMPASLYTQAKFLPSILHRIGRYLCAREILDFVAEGTPWSSAPIVGNASISDERRNCNIIAENSKLIVVDCPEKSTQNTASHKLRPVTTSKGTSAIGDHRSRSQLGPQNEEVPVLDLIHPDLITDAMIECAKNRTARRKREMENNQNLDEWFNPKSDRKFTIKLVNFDSLKVKTFDKVFNFRTCAQPSLYRIMEAITLARSQDNLSLERLETMGDSFLKFSVSKHLYTHFPQLNEGQMTQWRSILVSNALLYQHGRKLGLGEFLAGGIFAPESAWLPMTYEIPQMLAQAAARSDVNEDVYMNVKDPSALLKMTPAALDDLIKKKEGGNIIGKMPENVGYVHARISDKSVADSVEALIGAYYTASGPRGALLFMEKLGLRGPTDEGSVPFGNISQVPSTSFFGDDPGQDSVEMHLPNYKMLEKLICYKFKDPWLLVEAFSHPCYMANRVTNCFQRLEFLGDAVLDFLITDHIYNSKSLTPGNLTDLRSALVNNVTFASLAVRYGLHTYLLQCDKRLQDAIYGFVDEQKAVGHQVTGHFKQLCDFDCSSMMIQDIEVPKTLGDIFESLAGAVYVDSGMSLDVTWKVFYRLMKNEIDLFSKKIPKSPVRVLSERFGAGRKSIFSVVQYEDLTDDLKTKDGVDSRLTYVQLGLPIPNPLSTESKKWWKIIGAGKNKQSAKLGATKFALKYLPAEEEAAAVKM